MAGTKNNQRVIQTKLIIRQTFLKLLKQRRFEEVTVTDICKDAKITRGTFYRYYQSTFVLMDQLKGNLAKEIIALIKERFDESDWDILPIIFEVLKKSDPEVVKVALNKKNGSQCISRIFASLKEAIRPTVMQEIEMLTNDDFDYLYAYVTAGISGILILWVEKGMNPDTSVIERSVLSIINRSRFEMAKEMPNIRGIR
ncbi:TetR/AcrR family transcriptional regulator [Liquorilactobacillus mali]|uniref:Transcription regulator n=2 Tax=Liquorilactobacillus mali TaxID=1618 RepID=A0A0R2DZ87_9LACO|nr:TetR/AcrR family transcriptional regulator [Liquorilactobacillus mali]KRN09247.1 transcription regulator [Liquorilactobacillus mali KCTC 3596 = DSM 20444]QFQ75764.1 TetR/AcrR family transcriptional regulator [Liquorilactobacillus mali]